MDNYEVNFPGEQSEPVPQPVPETQPVSQPKKVSPFADSPYIMSHEPQSDPDDAATQPAWQGATVEEPVAPQPKKKKGGKVWKAILCSVLVVAMVVAGCGVTAYSVNSYWLTQNDRTMDYINELSGQIEKLEQQIKDNSFTGNGNSISGSTNINSEGLTPGQIYAKCVNSVVAITATIKSSQGTGASSGSGFIISEDGYIVSNYHVVEGATSLSITTHNGEQHTATVIGYDDRNDLALLKADATGLTAVKLGSSNALIVGDQVVAIGNPLGELSATLTVGYVSGKDRTVTTDGTVINMIQTDAAINPGNSGGPLFNMKGEVVGITTAKYSGTTSSGATIEGIGFAIPIDDIAEKILEIQENGYVSTPYMGIEINNRFDGMGVYVVSVESDGAAAKAGMKPGDLIVSIGDTEVTTLNALDAAMRKFKVGDTASITVYRSGKLVELTLVFGEKPHSTTQTPAEDSQTSSTTPQTPSDSQSGGSFKDFWDHFFGNGAN